MNAYSNTSKLPPESFGSFKNGIIDKSMISSALKSYNIVKIYNITDMIAYLGEVNVSNLPRPLFKLFVEINSQESYLTRNFQAHKSAKNQSER